MNNILITSAGRRVSLVQYFQNEATLILKNAKVFTTDLDPEMAPACIISDRSFKVGRFADPNYIDELLSICLKFDIGLVIPTIDTELLLLSEHRNLFKSKGIEIVISDRPFIAKCRDKRNTHKFFKDSGIPIPNLIDRNNPSFPAFIKPIGGSSSKNLFVIKDKNDVFPRLLHDDSLIWMEYLNTGEFVEYTLDLYYSKEGQLKCCVPRIRLAVRGGESNKGITHKEHVIINFVINKLKAIQGARGCLTFQLFKHKASDLIYGIEINPRFGGGYPLSYLAGANYPRWIIEEYLLRKNPEYFDNWEDNLLLLRYDHELIVHDHKL